MHWKRASGPVLDLAGVLKAAEDFDAQSRTRWIGLGSVRVEDEGEDEDEDEDEVKVVNRRALASGGKQRRDSDTTTV
ncbi:hypothetical protein MBM_00358 [Drepanopeziza brunnea f. sp. 'multigermtubi' MB_m1]|uniref:Uncharacterized protein n=1 Tax=Marssonina brunnea f. sp. multigermtubi (strain MB_m1) TaxID=1072389 RepID=K1WUA3_MARBU|nr:uncharacterized protein MBM_00358 [Drepanopeziza brunnea f. sp. 'multigermtubi' MB_m1]EKD21245.1 hypothetical protein MBM_00358 [Drepanopeziza brunnea f. sp. 'multigermtubi' MB_m1]